MNPEEKSMTDTIEKFMTRSVHTIGTKAPLAEAHRMMNDHGIRHLPVLEGGRLVGMLSQRDLHLIETIKDVEPNEVQVEEAMSPDCYTAEPEDSLAAVAREMAQHKYGSAVILRSSEVLGIFTTTDALRALDMVLTAQQHPTAQPKARKVTKAVPRKTPQKRVTQKARKGSRQAAKRSRR
jgi:acetoin utilization protein AcuB